MSEFLVEEMDDHVNKVQENPFALFVASPAEDSKTAFSAELYDFIGDGTGLTVACAGSDEKIIGCGAFAFKVEHNYVSAMSFEGDFGRLE